MRSGAASKKSHTLILLLTFVALTHASGQAKRDSTIRAWADSLNAYFAVNASAVKKTPFRDFKEAVEFSRLPTVVKKAEVAALRAASRDKRASRILASTLIGLGAGALAGITFWAIRHDGEQLDRTALLHTATGATIGGVLGLGAGISKAKDAKRDSP